MDFPDTRLLRLIAFFKVVKAATLILTGVGILKMVHVDPGAELYYWATNLGLDTGGRWINHLIQAATTVPPHRVKELGMVSFLYAGLFLTEGIGLWMLKRWAEWFTVIATGSLIPIECYEIYRHPSAVKVFVLIVNIAVVAYLVYRIRHEPAHSYARPANSRVSV